MGATTNNNDEADHLNQEEEEEEDNDDEEEIDENDNVCWKKQGKELLWLASAIVLVQLGGAFPPVLTTSYVGRLLQPVNLDGFNLAFMSSNLLSLSMIEGFFIATDTLAPQAFGARNYREVGLVALRGYVACILVLLPINIFLSLRLYRVLIWTGQDAEASVLATQFYRIVVLSFPFYALYHISKRFLWAQQAVAPMLVCMFVACFVVLPLLLQWLVPRFGFLGAACSMLLYPIVHSLLLVLYARCFQPHHPDTAPRLLQWSTWKDALAIKAFGSFVSLGLGGFLATSEWWFWEITSFMIGRLGVLAMSVHTIATQVLTIAFMIPLGIGFSLSIRIGATLAQNGKRARTLALVSYVVCFTLCILLNTIIYVFRRPLFRLFTHNAEILELCEAIWWKVVMYCLNLSLFSIHSGIATALGMQWMVGVVTSLVLWLVGLPTLYVVIVVRNATLGVAWTCMYPLFFVVNVVVVIRLLLVDWDKASKHIQEREAQTAAQHQQQEADDDNNDVETSQGLKEPLLHADGTTITTTTTR